MDDITVLSDMTNDFKSHKVTLDLTQYYQEQLSEKGKQLSRAILVQNCEEINRRLYGLLSLDFLKNLDSLNSACEAAVLLPVLTTPMLPRKVRAEMMEPLLSMLCRSRMQGVSAEDQMEFVKQLIQTVLRYSALWGDESQDLGKKTARSLVGAFGKKVAKLYKQAVPVDLYNLKRVLAGMNQAIGVYIINRIYLDNSQEKSIHEALYYYKVILTKRLEDIIGFFTIGLS